MILSPGYRRPIGPDSRNVGCARHVSGAGGQPARATGDVEGQALDEPRSRRSIRAGGTIVGYVAKSLTIRASGPDGVGDDRPAAFATPAAATSSPLATSTAPARRVKPRARVEGRTPGSFSSSSQTGRKTQNTRPNGWGRVRLAPRKRSDQFRRRIKASPHSSSPKCVLRTLSLCVTRLAIGRST